MEFRRIHDLPPYVFATVDQLKRELRRDGRDVIDLGFGNPDIPSPPIAVEKLRRGGARSRSTTATRRAAGCRNLRQAVCERYASRFGVALDPDDARRQHDRREGRPRAPDVGAARAAATAPSSRARATRSTSSRRASPARPSSTPASSGDVLAGDRGGGRRRRARAARRDRRRSRTTRRRRSRPRS